MAKVLMRSEVKSLLTSRGWQLAGSVEAGDVYLAEGDRQLAVLRHPENPDLVRLGDLLGQTPDMNTDFVALAKDESLAGDLRLDVLIDPGQASTTDIEDVFSALDDLERAVEGFGLSVSGLETEIASNHGTAT